MTDPRINLADAATLNVRAVSLVVYPIDATTLGTALAIDASEFGQLVAPLTIEQVRVLGQTCTRAAQSTPQELAALMAAMTNSEEEKEGEN